MYVQMYVLGRAYIFLRVNFQVGTYCVRNGPRKGEGILFWMMEYPYEIAAMILPVQVLLAGFYFHRKYPPLRQSRIFASVIAANLCLTLAGVLVHSVVLHVLSYLFLLVSLGLYFGAQNPERFMEQRTGIFNRQAFERVMRENKSRRFWLVSCCIHSYGEVRELYGAAQMDRCLGLIGVWLQQTFPKEPMFYLRNGRFVILSFSPFDQAGVVAAAYRRFQESWQIDAAEMFVGVGCAVMDSSVCAESVDDIFDALEIAHRQQDQAVVPSQMPIRVDGQYFDGLRHERAVKRALKRAIAKDDVSVFFQPIVDAHTQKIVGAEALARIYDEKLGYIAPSEFIPLAEKTGSITELGMQVFRKVCAFMSEPRIRMLQLDWVNINLSPIQCMNPHLAEDFISIQQKYQVPAHKLHLEITEESIINLNTLQNQIARMREAGFSFVLDDYGSGYSNLMMVRQIPFINIKLDMGFVRAHFSQPNTLLPDTIRAFLELGFSITAEGVESEAMALALDRMDTTYLQGFHYARPMPMEDFYQYMRSHAGQETREEVPDCDLAAESV